MRERRARMRPVRGECKVVSAHVPGYGSGAFERATGLFYLPWRVQATPGCKPAPGIIATCAL